MRYWRDWSSDVCSSDLARPDLVARLLGGEAEDLLAHACGLGTSKPSLRTAGAASRISSRGQLGRGSSGRSALVIGTTCDVGGEPSRLSSPNFSMCPRNPERSPPPHLSFLLVPLP